MPARYCKVLFLLVTIVTYLSGLSYASKFLNAGNEEARDICCNSPANFFVFCEFFRVAEW